MVGGWREEEGGGGGGGAGVGSQHCRLYASSFWQSLCKSDMFVLSSPNLVAPVP